MPPAPLPPPLESLTLPRRLSQFSSLTKLSSRGLFSPTHFGCPTSLVSQTGFAQLWIIFSVTGRIVWKVVMNTCCPGWEDKSGAGSWGACSPDETRKEWLRIRPNQISTVQRLLREVVIDQPMRRPTTCVSLNWVCVDCFCWWNVMYL